MKKSLISMGTSVIDARESKDFACASGDFNPLHLDAISARRYQFGSTLIHGINGTLRALDFFFQNEQQPVWLSSLEVTFSKPVQQGCEMEFLVERTSTTSAHIEIHSQGRKVQTIKLSFTPGSSIHGNGEMPSVANSEGAIAPINISIEQAEKLCGSVPLVWNSPLFADLFAQLADKVPASQCATILGTTNIVGMLCPGLNSVYARLSLTFCADSDATASQLDYRVESTDLRFARVIMAVSNAAASGEIEAFFRPAPTRQSSFTDIKPLVKKDQFSAQNALIVGGSRGLGEVTAKVLAAGGAKTLITYANGREDALLVAEDITEGGGLCDAIHFDILCGEIPASLLTTPSSITHIYYMVSPLIETSGAAFWDANLFNKYTDFYIRGLADILTPLTRIADYRDAELNIYLPSTVFLDSPEKGFSQYIVAKSAVESFAAQLMHRYPKWKLHTPRLPRMLTDQTSGIAGLDPLDNSRHILASLSGS